MIHPHPRGNGKSRRRIGIPGKKRKRMEEKMPPCPLMVVGTLKVANRFLLLLVLRWKSFPFFVRRACMRADSTRCGRGINKFKRGASAKTMARNSAQSRELGPFRGFGIIKSQSSRKRRKDHNPTPRSSRWWWW